MNFILALGNAGVVNDFYDILAEVEDLERKGLLNSLPDNISDYTKLEIEVFHDSAGIKQYLKDKEQTLETLTNTLLILLGLTLTSLIVRIYLGFSKYFK